MDVFFIKAIQFILSISLLVALHEGGHFFFSKLFKVRVEKFSLFFDPWFTLFSTKHTKWFTRLFPRLKDKETDYCLGWLPLGGYVKISGMIDESMDLEQMKQPEQPWEFRAKPAWQRLFIMIGGVLVNFLLALFIYSAVLFVWGETYLPAQKMNMGMQFNESAKALGFQDHDILVGTDQKTFKKFNVALFRDISEAKTVTVLRDSKEVTLTMPEEGINMLQMLKEEPRFMQPWLPAVVDSVLPGTPAALAHLQKGDSLLALGETPVRSMGDFNAIVGRLSDRLMVCENESDSLQVRTTRLVYSRLGQRDTVALVLDEQLHAGFTYKSELNYYTPEHEDYNLLASIPAGIRHGLDVLGGYVSDMKYLFSADGAKSVGGFGTIGSIFPATWNWQAFWEMTAFLSIILAFMNILPIPALDGGHVLFLLYEIIARRKPSDKFMEKAQMVGMGLLIALMVLANLNDIIRFLL